MIFDSVLQGVVWTFQSILIPLSRLTFYLLIIAVFLAFIANLAGLLGAIIFFIVFYYYVRGIIFVKPASIANS
jgi:hypothetical protein